MAVLIFQSGFFVAKGQRPKIKSEQKNRVYDGVLYQTEVSKHLIWTAS